VNRRAALRVAVLLLAGARTAYAAESGIDISAGRVELRDGVWLLSAQVEYRLSDEVLEALRNGIAISFGLEAPVTQDRRWWPDAEVAVIRQESRLSYEPLSAGYVVRNSNSGATETFGSLEAALKALGRIESLPVIDAALLEADEAYTVSLRAALDQDDLPGPLRMLAFWSSGLDLESRWYRWPLAN
jgi:hypothetical protein